MSTVKPNGRKLRYLLDTSALLTLSDNEPGAEMLTSLLEKARRDEVHLYLSFMSAMEAAYKMYQSKGEDGIATTLAYLQELPITRIDVSGDLLALAARMKGAHRMSVADAWILATAKQLDAILIHKDPEFEQAQSEVQLHALPYKGRRE